jgi:hypothetical protein
MVGEQHYYPVDADAQTAGRRHPVLHRQKEVLIQLLRFLITFGAFLHLFQKALALIEGII